MSITTKVAAVYDALMSHLAQIDTGSPGLPIDYPETVETFDPPSDGKYLTASYHPNSHAWEGLAGDEIRQGFILVSVVWPKNSGGLVDPMQIAGMIEGHFSPPLALHSSGFTVKLRAPYAVAPVIEPSSVRVPVAIPWTA